MAGNGFEVKTEEPTWQAVLELLASGQYESAAMMLERSEAAGDNEADPAVESILRAAREMCLAGNDYQAAVEYHKQAYQSASERERQLRQHLQSLLGLLASRRTAPQEENGTTPLPVSSSELVETVSEIPSLLRRLQSLLGHSSSTLITVEKDSSVFPREDSQGKVRVPPAGPALAVHCLGSFAVYQNDRLITDWSGQKGLTILKYLVAQRGKPVPKDVLMEVLWPNEDPEAARRNLHQAVYSLRQTLRQHEPDFQHIRFKSDTYQFNADLTLWIDFVEFERYSRLAQQQDALANVEEAMSAYMVAEELYQGNFLEEDPYEEWTTGQRERLRILYLRIVDQLAAHYYERQEYMEATALAQKALRQDPCYEAAHRWLMQCYFAQGLRHLAVRQYQNCVQLLADELNMQPSAETIQLYEQIKCAT